MERNTFTLKLRTEDHQVQKALVTLGFSRDFDNEPFVFKTENLQEALEQVQNLDEECFEEDWELTKVLR